MKEIFEGHEQDIYQVDYASSGQYLASASGDRTCRTWYTDTGREALRLLTEDKATSVTFSKDALLLAGASLDSSIRIWSAQTGDLVAHFLGHQYNVVADQTLIQGHRDSVYGVAFDTYGTALFSASLDKTVKIWEGFQNTQHGTNMTVKTLEGHKVYYKHLFYLLV